jgi:hypothetical protein
MPYVITWYDDDRTILLSQSSARISYPEMHEMFDKVVKMAEETTQPFYYIFDLSDLKQVESMNIRQMQQLGQHPFTKHPRRMGTYIAALNPRVRVIVDIFIRLFPRYAQHLYTAADVQDALRQIASRKQKASTV